MKHYYFSLCLALLFFNPDVSGQNVPKPLNVGFLIDEGIRCHDNQLYDSARYYFLQVTRNDSLYSTACYEIALGYYDEEEYELALAYIKKAVNGREASIREQATVLMGTIYDDAGMPDSAIICYKIALKSLPYNTKLLYDLGFTYYKLDSLELSEQYLIQAITINPTYFRANFALGQLNEKMNRKIEALLCYYMANLITHSTDLARYIEFYLSDESHITPLVNEYHPAFRSFETVDEYINSKIAMTAKYKPIFKSTTAFARQGDLLFKYLEYEPNTNNFYMNYYVKILTLIREKKQIETCMYTYFSPFKEEKVQKWMASNASKVQKFYDMVLGEINQMIYKGFVNNTHDEGIRYVYNKGVLLEFGKYSDEKNKVKEGLWRFLEKNGSVSTTLNYDNGEPNGEMKEFNSSGQMVSSIPFVNGRRVGAGKLYYENGALKADAFFENNALHGELTRYFATGQKQKTENYKNGNENGWFATYYKNGNIADSVSWSNGKQNGIYCALYPNNQLSTVGRFVNNMIDGEVLNYYPDGKIKNQLNFVRDNITGKRTSYHPNGAIEQITFYNDNGNLIDTSKYFAADGILQSMFIYSNNEKNIQKIYYRANGSIFQKNEVINDNLVKIEYFDNEGKLLETTPISKTGTYIKNRNWLGNISSEGMLVNGEYEGRWINYGLAGNMEQVSYFKNGERNGTDTSFFSNGKIRAIVRQYDGYATYYNQSGVLNAEGYYVNDAKEGYWRFYNSSGKLSHIAYYTNNELDQWQQDYHWNGNLSNEFYFDNFAAKEIVQYDTAGIEYERVSIPDGACKIVLHYPDGTVERENHYIGGVQNGSETQYFPTGQLSYVCNKNTDEFSGTMKYYDEAGNDRGTSEYLEGKRYGNATIIYSDGGRSEYTYYNNQLYGMAKYYNSDNKLTGLIPYMEDEKHGLANYYDDLGVLAYQISYYEGVAIEVISPKNKQHIKVENDQKIITYYPNGTKSAELSFLNGYYNGAFEQYYSNGKLNRKYGYIAGEYHGDDREYYPTGTLKTENHYVYNEYDGVQKAYYPNGKLKEELFYIMGDKHGEQKYYNPQGVLEKTTVYYYGEIQAD